MHLSVLSMDTLCISRVTLDYISVNRTYRMTGLEVALFLTHQCRYLYYPRQRPALTTDHITSCSKWGRQRMSTRSRRQTDTKNRLAYLNFKYSLYFRQLVGFWKRTVERVEGFLPRKTQQRTIRKQVRAPSGTRTRDASKINLKFPTYMHNFVLFRRVSA